MTYFIWRFTVEMHDTVSFDNSTALTTSPQNASVNWVSIGSDNGLSPVWLQAITWTNNGLLSIGNLGTNFSEIWIKIHNFSFMKNAFEYVVCEMVAILSRGRWINTLRLVMHYASMKWLIMFQVMACAMFAVKHTPNKWWSSKCHWIKFTLQGSSLKNRHLKMLSPSWQPCCSSLSVSICVTGSHAWHSWVCYQQTHKQRVLMHRHQGLNVPHGLCHIYMRYLYIYELFIAFVCFVVCSLL